MNIFKFIDNNAPYILLGMTLIILILLILVILVLVQNSKLKQKYNKFMTGKDGKSLEDNLIERISDLEKLIACNKENQKNIEKIFKNLNNTYQKVGLVKYDAFHEMGGKLSFTLALLNKTNDGFVLNAMHSREGCYTYIKEIIKGNAIILLSEEEKEALEMAMGTSKSKK